jgi:diguanylate cyclase (GGDEF)-like protein/PAS domain S-box-containing protein
MSPARRLAVERTHQGDELERLCVRNLLANVSEQIYFKDLNGRFLRASKGQSELFGVPDHEGVVGRSDFDFYEASSAQTFFDDEQALIRSGESLVGHEERQSWPDKPDSWMLTSKYQLLDDDGGVVGTFGLSYDITRRVRAEEAAREYADGMAAGLIELRRVEHEMRTLLEGSQDAIVKIDRELRYVYANPAAARLLNLPEAEILGRTLREIGLLTGNPAWEPAIRRVLETGVPAEYESTLDVNGKRLSVHSSLAPLVETDGVVTGVLVASRDMTDRKLAEDALAHQAVHDPVTGLANRVLLLDRVEHALARLERNPGVVAVLFLDLDRFKVVNDSLGHAAGDLVLKEVARRLVATSRSGDTVARFGGDEFALLCEGLKSDDRVRVLAERIGVALAEPFVIDDRQITLNASIGVATTDSWERTADEMIRDADAAMYLAKERGRGRFEFFDARVRARADARLDIETGLRRALAEDEFHLVYQPLINLEDRRVTGLEALIRWTHPTKGPLSPTEFIPVAEETRLIVPIDRWVLNEACRQLAEWNTERARLSLPPLNMAVNMSGRQLAEPDVVSVVVETLHRHGIEPSLLCLEVTETAMLQEAAHAQQIFEHLAMRGVQIALDDFGTGYSSLGHLQRFPVNILKIDRSFVERLDQGTDGLAIVSAVIAMASALRIRTVGEGIETQAQLSQLTSLGCDFGQGFLLARPADPTTLREALGLPTPALGA